MIKHVLALIKLHQEKDFKGFKEETVRISKLLESKGEDDLSEYINSITNPDSPNMWYPGGEKPNTLIQELNSLGTEILNTLYSNGYADKENSQEPIASIIEAGTLLEELEQGDLDNE